MESREAMFECRVVDVAISVGRESWCVEEEAISRLAAHALEVVERGGGGPLFSEKQQLQRGEL